MAKLTRKTLTLFGGSGGTSNFGQFGSQAASAPVETKDIETIQALTAWVDGWQDAVALGQAPYLQDMNGWMYVHSYEQVYVLQEGIAEWDTGTTYFIGSIVKRPSTTEIYGSIIDTNVGNALPNQVTDSNWQYIGNLQADGQMPKYRRPNLVYVSATTVTIETGLSGVSGQGTILFPDGVTIPDSTSGHIVLDMTRVASLGGSPQSGLRTGTIANDTWYAVYAVKANSGANFVLVADTVFPSQANFATLNSNFGTNGWVYLGMIRNGDNAAADTVLLAFEQTGNFTMFSNVAAGNVDSGNGPRMASTVGATSLTYTYAAGGGGTQIPAHIFGALFTVAAGAGSGQTTVRNAANTATYHSVRGADIAISRFSSVASAGVKISNGASVVMDIFLSGFYDAVLGVGANPQL